MNEAEVEVVLGNGDTVEDGKFNLRSVDACRALTQYASGRSDWSRNSYVGGNAHSYQSDSR